MPELIFSCVGNKLVLSHWGELIFCARFATGGPWLIGEWVGEKIIPNRIQKETIDLFSLY